MSSRRPPTWTTWPSCTRAGPPGCEAPPPSMEPVVRHWTGDQPGPRGSVVLAGCHPANQGVGDGSGCRVGPAELLGGQRGAAVEPGSTAATALANHPLLGRTMLCGPVTPPLHTEGPSRCGSRVGKGLEDPPPPPSSAAAAAAPPVAHSVSLRSHSVELSSSTLAQRTAPPPPTNPPTPPPQAADQAAGQYGAPAGGAVFQSSAVVWHDGQRPSLW